MAKLHVSCLVRIFVVLATAGILSAEIHRAKPLRAKVTPRVFPPGPPPSFIDEAEAFLRQPTKSEPQLLGHDRTTWVYSLLSAALVGLSGIFPLIIIPLEAGKALRHGAPAAHLKLLLSFAVGGLLGDVFLHLLPEAWAHIQPERAHDGHMEIGLWVLTGMLSFLIIEKAFPDGNEDEEEEEKEDETEQNEGQVAILPGTTTVRTPGVTHLRQRPHQNDAGHDGSRKIPKHKGRHENGIANSVANGVANGHANGHVNGIANGHVNGVANGHVNGVANGHVNGVANGHVNGVANGHATNREVKSAVKPQTPEGEEHIKVSGWLNLMANVVDNFTHGLAVAGSYCVGTKTGVITTIAILLHEIPHEIGDFAILLRSGFDRWKAAKAQLLTASGGMFGAVAALSSESTEVAGDRTAWILPFTSGGFIYIALVTIVPDLLKETNPWESLKQIAMLLSGVGVMALVTLCTD